MKFISILFLFIFIGFLTTPAIISYVDKDSNIAMFFSMNEEEHTSKVKIDFQKYTNLHSLQVPMNFTFFMEKENHLPTLDNWKSIYFETVSPPPEFSVLQG